MKKLARVAVVMCLSAALPMLLLAQAGHGRMGGGTGGAGATHGRAIGPGSHGNVTQGMNGRQTPLKQSQIRSGAFRMLQQKTGMNATELRQKYASSGVRNFGQFASALVVSRNLGLDSNQVLSGVRAQTLGKTLQQMGVSQGVAKTEMERARLQIREANRNGS
jgi:hypothetical protein